MTLIIFKYCLPILLGYTLFVGIANRYVPFLRPKKLAKRPSWFLGLWTGVSVAIIMSFGLHLAYQMSLDTVFTLLTPGAWLLAAAMVPGIIGYLWYRTSIKRQIIASEDQRVANKIDMADATEFDNTMALDAISSIEMEETLQIEQQDIIDSDDQTIIWADANSTTNEPSEHDNTQLFDIDPAQFSEPVLIEDSEVAEIAIEVDNDTEMLDSEIFAREAADRANAMLEVKQLRESLEEESRLRRELENHLRATRKGLSELDAETRGYESEKAAALAELEAQLEEKVKRTAAAEAHAERQAEKAAALENELVLLRQDTLKAQRESRESVEARARALSTANKATTFGRQAMAIRARLETQVQEAEAELESKHKIMSSLIKALEKEKARTQEDVTSRAKQLILHEKQLTARRQLEEASRTADSKLTTRLVKKVAKARGYNAV